MIQEEMYQGVTYPMTIIPTGPQGDCSIETGDPRCGVRGAMMLVFSDPAEVQFASMVMLDVVSCRFASAALTDLILGYS